MALHTDDAPVKYDTIKDDLTGYEYPNNVDNTGDYNTNYLDLTENTVDNTDENYIDLVENTGTLKYEDDLTGYVEADDVDNNYIVLVKNTGTPDT